jgi:PAS domain S-box-containing protein
VTLLYAFFGGLWILGSDQLAAWIFPNPQLLLQINMYKGWFFIAVTASLFYLELHREYSGMKRMTAELQASEQHYQTLARISPVGIFQTDLNGATTYVNPQWCAISGLSAAQALGDGWLEAVHPNDKERLSRGWQKSTQLSQASFSDYRFVRPDGTLTWVMGQAVPEMNAENRIVGYIGTITDITERKQAEEALRESERKLRAIFEQAPLGIAAIDSTTGRFLTLNPRYCKIAGYSESEMLDHTFQEITHPDDLESDLDGLQRMREGQLRLFQMEKRYIRQDGSVVWVNLTSVPLWEAPGTELQHLAMVEDITERKQAEAALQASEQQLSLIYANISDVLFYLAIEPDDHYRVVSVNSAFLRATGLTQDQVVGKLMHEVIPEPAHALVFGNYKKAIQTKKIVDWEEVSDYPSGKKYGEVSIIPILDADGTCSHLIGTVHDITERKQSEEKLRRLADEFASLYEIAKEITVQSNLSTLLEIISDRAARLLNTSDAVIYLYDSAQDGLELAAANLYVLPRGTRLKVGEGVSSQVVRTRQPLIIDDYRTWHQRRPELEQLDVRAVAQVPLIYRDELVGVLGIAEIGTERKYTLADTRLMELLASQVAIAIKNARLRTELEDYSKELEIRVQERTTQLQIANRELESFSYSVSHDLRAPLRAISGFSEILARRHRASLNEEGQHYLDNIVQASERMGHLIDDLLTYARLGRSRVRREPVSLASLLGEIARNMQAHLDKNHGTLNLSSDFPVVSGDQTLLSQVFTNLFENAFTYINPNLPPQVSVTWQSEEKQVVIKVSDNGIGIPLEYQEKIFNMFQRLHSEDKYPGTGIGLATVKKSVELLGGSVWVESKVGAGSTFFIRLPKE